MKKFAVAYLRPVADFKVHPDMAGRYVLMIDFVNAEDETAAKKQIRHEFEGIPSITARVIVKKTDDDTVSKIHELQDRPKNKITDGKIEALMWVLGDIQDV